jgi:hypothetical protein
MNPSACSGNDASGFEKAVRGLLILGDADMDEPAADVDAGGSAPEGGVEQAGEAAAEGGPGEGGLLTRLAQRRAERRAIGTGDGHDDDRSNLGPEAGAEIERKATISGALERLERFGRDLLNAARRDIQEKRELLNDLRSATEHLLGPAFRLLAEVGLDGVQALLGIAGLVPLLGEWADGADLVISVLRGDIVGAGLGVVSLNPFGGQLPGLAKVARKMEQLESGARSLGKLSDSANGVAKSGTAVFKKHVGADGGRHVTVDIRDSRGSSLGEFHQVDQGRAGTAIEEVLGGLKARRPQAIHEVRLPDPEGAAARGRSMSEPSGQKYKLGGNDCVQGACDVANGGGANTTPAAVRQGLGM